MTHPLDALWGLIGSRPGLDAADAEWRERLGDELWGQLKPRLFVGNGHAVIIHRHAESRSYKVCATSSGHRLVCESTGAVDDQRLTNDEVRSYRLDVAAFRDQLARCLGMIPEPGPVRGLPNAIPVGEWHPAEATPIPAYLAMTPSAGLLQSEVRRLLTQTHGGFLLLVPEPPRLDTAVREQLNRSQAGVVGLRDVVEWDGRQLAAMPAWETHRHAYCRRHFPERMVIAPPQYEFRKTGDYWSVRFNGKYTTIKDAVGLHYLAYLLARPHEKVSATSILQAVTCEAKVAQTGSAGDQSDRQTEADLERRYFELQDELQDAEANHDQAAQERLRRELAKLADYCKTVKGFAGRMRQASDDADKIRRAMSQAIDRTISALKAPEMLPDAAQHLENAVKTGLFMSYEPEEPPDWSL